MVERGREKKKKKARKAELEERVEIDAKTGKRDLRR